MTLLNYYHYCFLLCCANDFLWFLFFFLFAISISSFPLFVFAISVISILSSLFALAICAISSVISSLCDFYSFFFFFFLCLRFLLFLLFSFAILMNLQKSRCVRIRTSCNLICIKTYQLLLQILSFKTFSRRKSLWTP